MSRIRVLIVETSSIIREMLRQSLGTDGELEILAVTASGQVALSKTAELRPDVVLLDVSPPEMDGLKTLAGLREKSSDVPIIIFSRLAARGSQTSVDVLLLGANDCVVKPETDVELDRCIRGELSQKLKSLGRLPKSAAIRASVSPTRTSLRKPEDSPLKTDFQPTTQQVAPPTIGRSTRGSMPSADIVAIAASTGGPSALASLFSALPASFATPVVVVQHMTSGFTTSLAESLRRQTGRNVREVDSIHPLFEAMVWIAPGGRHLIVSQQGALVDVAPNDGPAENECRPSADVLFRSVVSVYGPRTLAVVLTGMGCDGLAGCRLVRQAGGGVVVQDEASSISWGMPGQVANAGLADAILPLGDIAQEIHRRTARR